MKRNQLNETVTVTCYRKTKTMKRKDAINFYMEGMLACEGSEQERYANLYCQLMYGVTDCIDTNYNWA